MFLHKVEQRVGMKGTSQSWKLSMNLFGMHLVNCGINFLKRKLAEKRQFDITELILGGFSTSWCILQKVSIPFLVSKKTSPTKTNFQPISATPPIPAHLCLTNGTRYVGAPSFLETFFRRVARWSSSTPGDRNLGVDDPQTACQRIGRLAHASCHASTKQRWSSGEVGQVALENVERCWYPRQIQVAIFKGWTVQTMFVSRVTWLPMFEEACNMDMFDDSICHANTIFSLLLWNKHLNPFGYITIVLKWKASSMPSSLVPINQTKQLHFPPIICFAPPFEKPSSFSMARNSFTISILPFRSDSSRGSRTSNSMDHERFRASRSPGNSGGFLYETWRWCNFLSRCILTIFKCLFELKTTKLNCQVILRKLLIIWKKQIV